MPRCAHLARISWQRLRRSRRLKGKSCFTSAQQLLNIRHTKSATAPTLELRLQLVEVNGIAPAVGIDIRMQAVECDVETDAAINVHGVLYRLTRTLADSGAASGKT